MSDLLKLDSWLRSDEAPENCMQLSDLDGFLTGVVCSPELIPPSQWLPVAMRETNVGAPPEIIDLIFQRHNGIVAALNRQPPVLEPIFWQPREGHVIAMDWCEGFMEAYALKEQAWGELMRLPEGRQWMFPILAHLFDESGNSLVGAEEEQIDTLLEAAAEQIAKTVPSIFSFWQAQQARLDVH